MNRARPARLVVAIVVAMCVLTGCSGPSPDLAGLEVAQTVHPGVPGGMDVEPFSEGPAAGWIEHGKTFAIVTWGSGSCPAVATALAADGSNRVAVTFGPSSHDPCTADMAPTTHEFALPKEITGTPVVIDVSYEDWPETQTLTLE